MFHKNLSSKFTIRIPVDLKEDFINYCNELGISPSACIRQFMNSCVCKTAGARNKEVIRSYEVKRFNIDN